VVRQEEAGGGIFPKVSAIENRERGNKRKPDFFDVAFSRGKEPKEGRNGHSALLAQTTTWQLKVSDGGPSWGCRTLRKSKGAREPNGVSNEKKSGPQG